MKNGMKKLLAIVLLATMVLSAMAVAATASAEYKVKYIKTTATCNIRIAPDKNSEKIGTASKGQVYAYDQTHTDNRGVKWYGIVYGSYGTAWISSKNAVGCDKEGRTKKPSPKPTATPTPRPIDYSKFAAVDGIYMVIGNGVNMRVEPSTDYSIIGVYTLGDLLEGVKSNGSWMELKDNETGRVGYMSCKYLQEYVEPEPEIVETDETLENDEFETERVSSGIVDTFEELQKAVPNAVLVDAPAGSNSVLYAWIDVDGMAYPIAQINFKYQGVDFVLRAAMCENTEAAADIDGVTLDATHEEVTEEPMHVELSTDGQTVVVHYFDEAAMTQYSLTGPAINNGAEVEKMAQEIFGK